MYTEETLSKYKYFKSLSKFIKIEYLLDPLTGLVNRKYMVEFIKELINDNVPFTMAMLDLDNFKNINDNYGHTAGDVVLETIGNDLISFLGDTGVAGRFGGDEFIIVIFKHNEYNQIHDFYDDMNHNNTVLRKNITIGDESTYITGTIGSAVFPTNASTYEDLFEMADKTLYRGKLKGRNCYIIYVHEKHKDLQIKKLVNDDEATILLNIHSAFMNNIDFKSKCNEASEYIKKTLRLDYLFYINENGEIFNLDDLSKFGDGIDLSKAKFNNEIIKTNHSDDLKAIDSNLYEATRKYNTSSVLITKLRTTNNNYGYIMYALERTSRIWQSNEIAILLYLAKTITIDLMQK